MRVLLEMNYRQHQRCLSWSGSCLGMRDFMNSSGHLAVSEATARRVRKTRAHKQRSRNRGRNGKNAQTGNNVGTTMAAAGTLTRTKALLLAALRVWELKHR